MKERDLEGIDAYPGTTAFSDANPDRRLFFGRSNDIFELLQLVLTEPLVVLYADSGTGKTSLINAGLLPELRKNDSFPAVVRLRPERSPSLSRNVVDEIREICARSGVEIETGDDSTLWRFLNSSSFGGEQVSLRPVIVFDQFEELFTLAGGAAREAFVADFADVVRQRLPRDVREGTDERSVRLRELGPADLRIVIAIREDSLPELEALRETIPNVFEATMRLLPLTEGQAREAIVGPAEAELPGKERFEIEPEAVDQIVSFLARGKTVDAIQLQLICRHLDRDRRRRKAKAITRSDVGGHSELRRLVDRHFRGVLRAFPTIRAGWNAHRWEPSLDNFIVAHRPRGAIRRLCARELVTETGHRRPIDSESAAERFGVPEADLRTLEQARVLTSERRRERTAYELAHDSFVPTIVQERRRRRRILQGALVVVLVALASATAFFGGRKPYAELDRALDWRLEIARPLATASPLEKRELVTAAMSKAKLLLMMGLNFQHASLGAIDFTRIQCDFSGADFEKADLRGSRFRKADFLCTRFRDANADGVTFGDDTYLYASDFTGATLKKAHFTGDAAGVIFDAADLQNAAIVGADVTDARFTSTKNVETVNFDGTAWWTAMLTDAQFAQLRQRWTPQQLHTSNAFEKEWRKLEDDLQKYPDDVDPGTLYSMAFMQAIWADDPVRALPLANESLSHAASADHPDRAYHLDLRGYIHLALGNPRAALADFEQSCGREDAQFTGKAPCQFHRAMAHALLGQHEQAKRWRNEAIAASFHPTYEKLRFERLVRDLMPSRGGP